MKKIIILVALFAVAATSFGQLSRDSKSLQPNYFTEKSSRQKAAAVTLLVSGALLDIIGVATYPKDYLVIDLWGTNTNTHDTKSQANTSAVLLVIGSAAMLSSIPLFVSSRINRNKAIHIAVDTKQMQQLRKSNMHCISYPAITLKWRI